MNDQSIQSFLGNSDVDAYVIPKFQRSYSWNKIQITQFLSDFDNVMESENPDHFFGLIVFVPQEGSNDKVRDVIDGQQRTTTITIVLSILRDWLRDLKINTNIDEETSEDLISRISSINNCILNNKKAKLSTENENEYENEFLSAIINEILIYDKEEEPRKSYEEQDDKKKSRFDAKYEFMLNGAGGRKDKRKTKAKNALKNYDLIRNHIKTRMKDFSDLEKVKYLMKVTERVTKHFRVIEFKVSSYDKAFEYFEVLNDRGLDVSAIDLIKNNVLKCAENEQETNELFKSWKAVFSDNLNSNYNLIQFMRYSHMCENGHITAKEIYPSYKEKIVQLDSAKKLKAFIDDKLFPFASIYKDCNLSNCEIGNDSIHNGIQLVRSTKTSQWYSIALAALFPVYSEKVSSLNIVNVIVKLFEVMHEIMFSLNFVSYVANEIEKEFPKIAKEIKFGENADTFKVSLENAIQKLNLFKVEEKLTFDVLDFSEKNEELVQSFAKNNDLGSMFIYFLRYKQNSNNSSRICVTSLEHTYPQSPSKENWEDMAVLSENDKKEATYSLGNFFNVPKPENTSYGNKSWANKKNQYIDDSVFDVIDENHDLHYSNVTEWNKDIIEKRTVKIRELWNASIK